MSLDYSLHCAWCDARMPDRAALRTHESQHRHNTELRPSAEQMASELERAARAGLAVVGRVPEFTVKS